MEITTLNESITGNYKATVTGQSVSSKFIAWCDAQQPNRLLWLGIALAGHGCVITPIAVIAVVLGGVNMILFSIVLAAMTANLIVNLAALPTKITIPVLLASVFIDIAVIIACGYIGFTPGIAF